MALACVVCKTFNFGKYSWKGYGAGARLLEGEGCTVACWGGQQKQPNETKWGIAVSCTVGCKNMLMPVSDTGPEMAISYFLVMWCSGIDDWHWEWRVGPQLAISIFN